MDTKTAMEAVLEEVRRSAQEFLEWSQGHPGSTLRELEEKAKAWKEKAVAQVLEAAVALQGAGELRDERCSCGGEWVFQGYREREVMTSQGAIKVRRAYHTCNRCGAGIFPPGATASSDGGLE